MGRPPAAVKHPAKKRVKSRDTMSAAVDPSRCPLCGETNACGMAAGKSACWCKSMKIPPEVLEQVPPAARDEACVCERCATGTKRALRVPLGEPAR